MSKCRVTTCQIDLLSTNYTLMNEALYSHLNMVNQVKTFGLVTKLKQKQFFTILDTNLDCAISRREPALQNKKNTKGLRNNELVGL